VRVESFTYHLPKDLIAQEPCKTRDKCRLLVFSRLSGGIEHRLFSDLPSYLLKGDLLVVNNTRVVHARLKGRKVPSGGKVEVLLLERRPRGAWSCLVRPARRLRAGTEILFAGGRVKGTLLERNGGDVHLIEFTPPELSWGDLSDIGEIPLPPYIRRQGGVTPEDAFFYQTVYATREGAVAAPTAGLHFTRALFEDLAKRGVGLVPITLHTGWASFRPLRNPIVEENELPREYYHISSEAASKINQTVGGGGRVVAVGTTTTRALETQALKSGRIEAGEGFSSLFIYPGFEFLVTDALITNFHMSRSSLLLLVAALAGKKEVLRVYETAVERRYRFLSFGDAMLIQ